MQLLVRRTPRPERELLDAVAAERDMSVAVHESGDRARAATVHLNDVAGEARKIPHPPDRCDAAVLAEDVRVLDDVDVAERLSVQRRGRPRGRRDLREIANE